MTAQDIMQPVDRAQFLREVDYYTALQRAGWQKAQPDSAAEKTPEARQ